MELGSSPCVLIADDDVAIAAMTRQILEHEGYTVVMACDGEQAIKMIYEKVPDLVLLDIKMPKMDGYQVCRWIKQDVLLSHLPVLMLTVDGESKARVKGLDTGADDYIVKPFNPEELIARVRTAIRRSRTDLEANPLTRLPGNNTIEKITLKNIQQKQSFALLYIDLNNFKAYNDYYGFSKGDEVIRATARILVSVTDPATSFVGHVGGDDFVILTSIELAEPLCKKIIQQFDAAAPNFYSEEDRRQGYIETVNRQNQKQTFPLLSVAIGGVLNPNGKLTSLGEISKISAEVKKFAKKDPGSSYLIDRRS